MLKVWYCDDYELKPALLLSYNKKRGLARIYKFLDEKTIVERECKYENVIVLPFWNRKGIESD